MNPGIYIHVPFCTSKCAYCDFYSVTNLTSVSEYIKQLCREIDLYSETHQPQQAFDTIYLGGGTPSVLDSENISIIINKIKENFPVNQDSEITLEVNPGTVDLEKLKSFKSIGINRLSIGIQSFSDRDLKLLGRIHTVEEAEKSYQLSRQAGFEDIGIDLIYAIPKQDLKDWKMSLNKAIKLKPEHISAYNLTIEKGTPFFRLQESGHLELHEEKVEEEFFNLTHDFLTNHGYYHYEISNFAKSEKCISKHNCKYWHHVPYLGFGPSSHSFWNNTRWANVSSVEQYNSLLSRNQRPLDFEEILKFEDVLFEYIFLNLRTYQGIFFESFQNKFGFNFVNKYEKIINPLLLENLAILEEQSFKLTQKGMTISDSILPAFSNAQL